MDEADDLELLAAARGGDRAAVDRLLRRHVDRVGSLCRRLTGNDADAADATQEALIAIAKGLHRFDGRSSFATWAYRVATNACLDELRRRKRRAAPGLPEHDDGHMDPIAGAGPAVAGGGSEDSSADRLDVAAALARLPVEFRAPVVLRDLCGLDYAEIAEVLGLPPGTVRSRIARGRAALAGYLSDHATTAGNRDPGGGRPTPRP